MEALLSNFLSITILLCLMIIVTGGSTPCKECEKQKFLSDNTPSSEFERARIEQIKRHILDNLGMTEPPNVRRSSIPSIITKRNILDNLKNKDAENENRLNNNYSTVKSKVFLHTNDIACNCPTESKHSECLCFKLDQNLFKYSIASVYLWTYRNEQQRSNLTYIINNIQEAVNGSRRGGLLSKERVRSVKSGWNKQDISNVLSNRPKQYLIMQIICDECGSKPVAKNPDKRPFIVVNIDASKNLVREKRSATVVKYKDCCKGMAECCRVKFYISFSKIGWDNWVVSPPGYMANYCKGACLYADPVRHAHTMIIKEYILKNRLKNRITPFQPCCVPNNLSDFTIQYLETNQTLRSSIIPNMVVNSCDCS